MDQPNTPAQTSPDSYAAQAQQYAAYYAQQAQQQSQHQVTPTPPSKMGTGWKVLIGFVALSVLGACGLCGILAVSIPSNDGVHGDSIALIHVTGVISGTGSAVNGEQ
jgi:hypothetical protein